MSPREDVSEERKEQILDAATEVFAQKGFDHARMDDIVEETGLSKGALYWYFKSKDDIIFGIMDRLFRLEFRELEEIKQSESSATEALRGFTEVAIKDINRMLHFMPITYEFLALAFRNKLVQKAIKQYMNSYVSILDPLIQRGVESGEFKKVNPREVSAAVGAIIEGTMLLWVYDRNLIEPEKNIRASITLLLDGVKA
ncbi:MAG: TetR/AcrR family transcriptional regulator [Anaerolineales bacterium]|jgi:AcrR family transcriptional regulator